MSIFLMLSLRFLASRVQLLCSPQLPPAVGSGAPLTVLMSVSALDSNSSSSLWAVGRICWGMSLMRY